MGVRWIETVYVIPSRKQNKVAWDLEPESGVDTACQDVRIPVPL